MQVLYLLHILMVNLNQTEAELLAEKRCVAHLTGEVFKIIHLVIATNHHLTIVNQK